MAQPGYCTVGGGKSDGEWSHCFSVGNFALPWGASVAIGASVSVRLHFVLDIYPHKPLQDQNNALREWVRTRFFLANSVAPRHPNDLPWSIRIAEDRS